MFLYLLPANVFLITISLLTPSNCSPVAFIIVTAVTYIRYVVNGLRLLRVYDPVKSATVTVLLD